MRGSKTPLLKLPNEECRGPPLIGLQKRTGGGALPAKPLLEAASPQRQV